jgi:dihydroorotase/N-acyl-D-amino-acid deacylase
VGKNFAEIGGADPAGTAIDLLIEERGAVNMVSFNQSVENLRELLTHPLCTVISDGFYVKGRPHPRLYGTFPFLLGEIVRERKWMTLETAVHKITQKPAARLKLRGRGMLQPGMAADVTVFDPLRIAGPASYESPEQPPAGLVTVYRNGRKVL